MGDWSGEERRDGHQHDLLVLANKIEYLAVELARDRETRAAERQEDRRDFREWREKMDARLQRTEDMVLQPGGLNDRCSANTAGRKRLAAIGMVAATALAAPLGLMVWKTLMTTAGG